MQTFSKVHIYDRIEETAAAVDTDTGELYISKADWNSMDEHEKAYVLLHELGHLNGHYKEKAADKFALSKMKEYGYTIHQGVQTLSNELDMKNSAHRNRVVAAFKYAQRNSSGKGGKLNDYLN